MQGLFPPRDGDRGRKAPAPGHAPLLPPGAGPSPHAATDALVARSRTSRRCMSPRECASAAWQQPELCFENALPCLGEPHGSNFRSDAVTLVSLRPCAAARHATRATLRFCGWLVSYKAASSRPQRFSLLTGFQRAEQRPRVSEDCRSPIDQFFAAPVAARPPQLSESPFGQEAESEQ